ncbi:hypothetical protein [Haloarcula quadrata]|nr:hypothetical protein [Haloarcula quadrata]
MLTELTFHGLDIARVEPDGDLIDFVADELPAGAALLFGQADQQIPTTAVRGMEYQHGRASRIQAVSSARTSQEHPVNGSPEGR